MSNIVYGKNSVVEYLRSMPDQVEKVYIYENLGASGIINEIFELIKKNKIPFTKADKSKLHALSEGGNHQGIVLTLSSQPYSELDDIFKKAKQKNELPFIIILDSVNDPHNFGSIIRTAEFAGAHGIIVPKRNNVGITAAVNKVSCGAAAYLPIVKVSNLNYTIDKLKKENIWVVGADCSAKKSYNDVDYKMPVAILLGSEGFGFSRILKESCDFLVKIPQHGNVSSLNVGVSAGIMIYEVVRQRNSG